MSKKRKNKNRKARALKAAKHLDSRTQHVAFTLSNNRFHRKNLGTFGPASEVRHIDPSTLESQK